MAAIVHHPRLQLHLESQLVESRTLTLRLPSPKQSNDLAFKSCFPDSNINKTETFQDNKPNNSGWNFVDALSNISQGTTTTYVHPQQNRSTLVLSSKSLELCTENLGNESGTNIVENDILLLSLMETKEEREPCRQVLAATKKVRTQNFPPPLTTTRGSESLRVRPHREDGRLVVEVTKIPRRTSCFQAARRHGRLLLCFSTNQTTCFDSEEEEEDSDIDIDDGVIDENEEPHNEEEFSKNEII